MGELIVQNVQYVCLQVDNGRDVFVIYPAGQFWRIDFLVLHGNEEAGLCEGHCFELVFDVRFPGEVQVHVVDSEVQGGPF